MSEPVQVIGYAMPDVKIRQPALLRLAWLTGLTPLLVGIGTLVGWMITRQAFWMGVGLWTIVGGAIITAVGFVCLLIYFCINRPSEPSLRSKVNRQSGWALTILILNYPAAIGCIAIFAQLEHP